MDRSYFLQHQFPSHFKNDEDITTPGESSALRNVALYVLCSFATIYLEIHGSLQQLSENAVGCSGS